MRSARSSSPALTFSGPPITAEPETVFTAASSLGLKSCSAASSGVGNVEGRPARRRANERREGPASQRARSSSSAQMTATATITFGSPSHSEGWKLSR